MTWKLRYYSKWKPFVIRHIGFREYQGSVLLTMAFRWGQNVQIVK